MATVLDEFIIQLGLDPAKFTAGQKVAAKAIKDLEEQATKSGKETEAQSKKLLDFFTNLKREALGFLGAFYGGKGIKEVVEHLTHMDASVARLAPLFNTNVEALAKWRIAMREMGFSAGDADEAIGGLSQRIQDFITNPANAPVGLFSMLQQMGVRPGETDPIKILEAAGRFAQTPEMQAHPEQFESRMRSLLGLSPQMIQLLRELGPRLKEAEPLVPGGGGLGPFSKEFISAMNRFSIAAENVARVLLENFVKPIESLTALLTKWLIVPGSPEAQELDTKFEKNVRKHFGTPKGFIDRLYSEQGTLSDFVSHLIFGFPEDKKPKKVGVRNTFVPGEEITGVQIYSDTVTPSGGAKKAAAVSNVTHDRSSRTSNTSTSEVNIGTINVNAPNATDAPGIAGSIKPALGGSLGAPVNSAY